MYSEDLEALEVTVRAMEAKLREIRACIQREQAAIPKARLCDTLTIVQLSVLHTLAAKAA